MSLLSKMIKTDNPRLVKCPITDLEYVRIPDPVGHRYYLVSDNGDLLSEVVQSIWMCRTQFTISAFDKLMNEAEARAEEEEKYYLTLGIGKGGPNVRKWQSEKCPLVNVDVSDVIGIAGSLKSMIGIGFRLPTEFEWEWSALGGEDFEYSGCTNWRKVAWCLENSGTVGADGEIKRRAHDVALLKPNGYGLYDMSGNVWEWTSSKDRTNKTDKRACRGGSYDHQAAAFANVMHCSWTWPTEKKEKIGFRLCFTEPLGMDKH